MSLSEDKIVEIDRAAFELRRGRAVRIGAAFFMHPEFVHNGNWAEISQQNPKLIVTAKRAAGLFAAEFECAQELPLATENPATIALLASGYEALELKKSADVAGAEIDAALALARISQLLPTVVRLDAAANAVAVSAEDILGYKKSLNENLKMVAQTPLKLKNARKAKILAFRPPNGDSEHLAIVIGDVGEEPLIRLHSSCYTGDLLGSLACDCGDQLSECIKLMDNAGGGVIVYLLQEGRGIGLINKLHAYALQDGGLDTVEANEFLGFDDEEREFEPAVKILEELGVSKAKLVSNNPRKAKDLRALGIDVTEMVPLLVTHEHNHDYVQTKGKKSGHIV